jgi:P4 family phage/plasmid primase-like protien
LLNIFNTVKDRKLLPVVPIFNNANFPSVPWKSEINHIDTIEKLEQQGEYFDYKNKNNEAKKGKITGASLLTGEKSGVMVLDLDRNHGTGEVDGVVNYKKLVDSLNLSEEDKEKAFNTFTVKTPNGGLHLYFNWKEGLKSDSNNKLSIDLKTSGGLIVAPGSIRKMKDGTYKTYTVYKDVEIQEMPDKLFNELLKYFGKVKPVAKNTKIKTIKSASNNHYTVKNEGERDAALFKYLCSMIDYKFFKNEKNLFELAKMYNQCYINPPFDENTVMQKTRQAISYVKKPYCSSTGKVVNGSLVKYILNNNDCYVKGNMFYIYDKNEGIYKYKDSNDLLKMYYDNIVIDEDIDPAKAKKFADTIMGLGDRYTDTFAYEDRYIACENGIIDSLNNELLEFNPKYKLDCKFNGSYMKDRQEYVNKFNQSRFKRFLNDLLDESTISTLQEAWGTILCPNSSKVQQCFIYIGLGSNGKSSLFDIQEALLKDADKSICGISLGAFGDDFILSMAEGKRMNVVRDDAFEYKISGLFKSCVCGEEVTVNKKHKDYVRIKFNLSWFYGLNTMPITSDKSFGFYRRPILIPFNNRFGSKKDVLEGRADKEAIPGIVEEIINNEMDIVFNWAFEGLQRLIKNKWKINQSQAALNKMEEYKEESDSAYAFYKYKLIKSIGSKISASSLYKDYEEYCTIERLKPMNPTQFGRQLKSLGHEKFKSCGNMYFKDLAYVKFIPIDDDKMPF